ncbi:MAG: phenylacetate-CoA oxygenase subunit PaaC [Phycisphaerae bacterium]|jgi:ring-1,2-phenylacetyl-CoA epoxidase subunit PaaC
METLPDSLTTPLVELLLSIADDKLILGSRNSDWTGLAPILEEDIAFSALAQDDIAHAASLYEFVAQLTGDRADRLAYGRQPEEYRCAQLVELEDGFDWANVLARQFYCDHLDELRLSRLARSCYRPLAALAARLLAEERLSLGHADGWISRLLGSTEEARQRMLAALTALAAPACALCEPTVGVEALESAGVYPPAEGEMFALWSGAVAKTLQGAGVRLDLRPPGSEYTGGRRGRRSEAFAALLDEIAEVYRVEPEAAW